MTDAAVFVATLCACCGGLLLAVIALAAGLHAARMAQGGEMPPRER